MGQLKLVKTYRPASKLISHFRDRFSGRHYLVGLVSYGIGSRHRVSCGTRKGAVYVNVLHYLRWINKVNNSDRDP